MHRFLSVRGDQILVAGFIGEALSTLSLLFPNMMKSLANGLKHS